MKEFIEKLNAKGLHICDFDIENNKMCLKNDKDEIVFVFNLVEGKTTMRSLQDAVSRLDYIINYYNMKKDRATIIHVERARHKMSQLDLARELNVPRQVINHAEITGNCSLPVAIKISQFFGKTVEELWK